MKHVVLVGGGISSTLMLPLHLLYVDRIDKKDIDFIMCKLPNEHEDVWKLCKSVENLLDIRIEFIGKNQTPFELFHKEKFIGNNKYDSCSKVLKRRAFYSHLTKNYDKENTTLYVGIKNSEIDRTLAIFKNYSKKGWDVKFPLIEYENIDRQFEIDFCLNVVGFVPDLYLKGFQHNNCAGACVKAGHKEWERLLYHYPEVYNQWEENEQNFIKQNGNFTILRDRRGGITKPYSLKDFRINTEKKWKEKPPTYIEYCMLGEDSGCKYCEAI